MDFIPEDIAASLPPTRADEPVSLRQDILDELRDHLQCAVRREQLLGATDHQSAWQRVLARFGNPTEIARKLYSQAMWSRIMQQRIVVASGIGILAACVTMAGFMWVMLERQQQQADRQQAWAERQQANFETMLARFNGPPNTMGSLIMEADRPFTARFSGGPLKQELEGTSIHPADPSGSEWCDFGDLAPGIYTLRIWGDRWLTQQKFLIKRGDSLRENVRIPVTPETPVEVTFTSNLPTKYVIYFASPLKKMTYEGREWTYTPNPYEFYIRSKPSTLQTYITGAVQLKLLRRDAGIETFHSPNGTSTVGFRGELNSPSAQQSTPTPNEHEHIIELDLKPGPNECHVELPKEWITVLRR